MNDMLIKQIRKNGRVNILLGEFVLAVRFGLVGALATAVHFTILWILLSKTSLPVLVANTIAFVSAFGFSFIGHYLWTFGAPGSPRTAMYRFLIISISAFLLNTLLLSALLLLRWFPPKTASICSVTIIPVVTFFASRFWGFKQPTAHSLFRRTTKQKSSSVF